ncbi:MAG: hypothetical protein JOZ69_00805 [Myxococcales bacterium]|nr:hypothetical protein [Myxococcales bacterium]
MRKAAAGQLLAGGVVALGIGLAALWRAMPGGARVAEPVSSWSAATSSAPAPGPDSGRASTGGALTSRAIASGTMPAEVASRSEPGDAALGEPELMARLRALASTDPAAAVEVARDGNRRFPRSADAGERASLLVHSLARLGRTSEARGEAEDVVNDLPDSPWVREIEGFTGAHRHRNLRLAADGGLEFY